MVCNMWHVQLSNIAALLLEIKIWSLHTCMGLKSFILLLKHYRAMSLNQCFAKEQQTHLNKHSKQTGPCVYLFVGKCVYYPCVCFIRKLTIYNEPENPINNNFGIGICSHSDNNCQQQQQHIVGCW